MLVLQVPRDEKGPFLSGGRRMADVMITAMSQEDELFFEILTKVVFYTGFHRGVVERKWTFFQEAFCGFAIDKVASFDENDVERLLSKESLIIKNARKVKATVENAKICLQIIDQYGSLRQFVQFAQEHKQRSLEGEFRKDFRLVGESAAHSFHDELRLARFLV